MSKTVKASSGGAATPLRRRSRTKNQRAGQAGDPVWVGADQSLTEGLLRTLSRSARHRLRLRRARSADNLSPA